MNKINYVKSTKFVKGKARAIKVARRVLKNVDTFNVYYTDSFVTWMHTMVF